MAEQTLAQLIYDNWADLVKIPAVAENHQAYDVIAAYLRIQRPIANPTPRGTVPRPLSLTDVFGVIAMLPHGAAEMAKLSKLPQWAYQGGVDAMTERADGSMTNWLQTIAAICGFEPDTVTAMLAAKAQLLAATIPDPNWSATIAGDSIATAAGLGTVTAADVQAADQASGGAGQYGATV